LFRDFRPEPELTSRQGADRSWKHRKGLAPGQKAVRSAAGRLQLRLLALVTTQDQDGWPVDCHTQPIAAPIPSLFIAMRIEKQHSWFEPGHGFQALWSAHSAADYLELRFGVEQLRQQSGEQWICFRNKNP